MWATSAGDFPAIDGDRVSGVARSCTKGLLALVEAKPGKGDELADFLKQGRELAVTETGTVPWYAFPISETAFGIFDTFAGDPDIRTVDVVAVK